MPSTDAVSRSCAGDESSSYNGGRTAAQSWRDNHVRLIAEKGRVGW